MLSSEIVSTDLSKMPMQYGLHLQFKEAELKKKNPTSKIRAAS